MDTDMTASEAVAELTAIGAKATIWTGHGNLVTIYWSTETAKGEIWCRSISRTVRNVNQVWAAIARIINAR